MSCCSEFVNIGCVNACNEISLGYNATENGVHQLEFYFSNGSVQMKGETYVSGNDMTVSADILNESREYDLKILMPSGSYYEFISGVDCLKLRTQIVL